MEFEKTTLTAEQVDEKMNPNELLTIKVDDLIKRVEELEKK